MAKLLIIDTETGGLDPERHSIIQLGAVVWEDGQLGESIELLICEMKLSLSDSAMAINRIPVEKIYAEGLMCVQAVEKFHEFLNRNFPEDQPIILAGHNVGFDISFMKRLYKKAHTFDLFEKTYSHRSLDTAGIVRFLILAQKLPSGLEGSDAAFKHFGIEPTEQERHTAMADAKSTGLLLTNLLECLK